MPEAIRQGLSDQGAKRRQAKQLRADAARELARLVPQARAQGISIVEIAARADLSRPAVYTLLDAASAAQSRE